MHHTPLFMTDAQLGAELERCEYCEEKPCTKACPADCSPADFIMAARGMRRSDFARAAAHIMTKNPLGGVCGAICPDTHCQAACSHKLFDRAIEIPTVQAALVARAKALGVMPELEVTPASGHKVAIVGAGPAGLAAALTLAQAGHAVDIFDRGARAGGACALIPPLRMDPEVLDSDVRWLCSHPRIALHLNSAVEKPEELLRQGFEAVLVAAGLHQPIVLGIDGESLCVAGNTYLAAPGNYPVSGRVAVIGGGAIACDCAVTARQAGAEVELFALEKVGEMPLTPKELKLLLDEKIQLNGRVRVTRVLAQGGKVTGLQVQRVTLPDGATFHPTKVRDVAGSEQTLDGFALVVVAIGNRPTLKVNGNPAVFAAGDAAHGAGTAVEAAAAGKNAALQITAFLNKRSVPAIEKPRKSTIRVRGYRDLPVALDVDFFGRMLPSPFLLSAAPPTDGYAQMKKALDAGWAGGIMKTAFDGVPIHIPSEYMHVFDERTYGNCDNVSDHPLSRVCEEIGRLVQEYPQRLIAASTGGPVTGNDASDRAGWVSNTKKLEQAGAMAIEYSLSCPQGGDGTEGDIVSQSPALTAKIIDWILAAGDPAIPKLFKLTGAVTSIAVIVKAVKEVLDRHPQAKAGVTLANTFPTLSFRPGRKQTWDEGILVGMSGQGVAPISNLSLASVARLGVHVSGNGGPMDYMAAAHFLALGARSVQFCTVAMKYGVHVVDELHGGLSHLMQERGIRSVGELIGRALPDPISGFMELPATKGIPQLDAELCMHCGNCTRCGYLAVSLDDDKRPRFDPALCIGCSLCTRKCFAGALAMRERSAGELAALAQA
jgi:NADPH-dependent glutamate synthase beta subunit-like oxidoreductase/dihydroorotate dehydrogenase